MKKVINIFETTNFWVQTLEKPHIPREDGGHIFITPKKQYLDRTKLPNNLAIEMMLLSIVVGRAMKIGLQKGGVKILRVNYQENGNWAFIKNKRPHLHWHLYGRTSSSKSQNFGEALILPIPDSGFYDNFQCLTEEDVINIRNEIIKLLGTNQYKIALNPPNKACT